MIETAKGIPEFQDNGYLPHKCYEVTLEEIKEKLVDNFPNSKTRDSRFECFLDFYEDLLNNVKSCVKILIDGSFVEKRTHPNDIDLVIIIDSELLNEFEYNYLNNECVYNETIKEDYLYIKYSVDNGEIDQSELYKTDFYKFGCDIHYFPKYSPDHPLYLKYEERLNYWIELFGSDRRGFPKGFLSLLVEYGDENEY